MQVLCLSDRLPFSQRTIQMLSHSPYSIKQFPFIRSDHRPLHTVVQLDAPDVLKAVQVAPIMQGWNPTNDQSLGNFQANRLSIIEEGMNIAAAIRHTADITKNNFVQQSKQR